MHWALPFPSFIRYLACAAVRYMAWRPGYDDLGYGPELGYVSPAPNCAVVPGQRRPENNSRDWSCHGPALKSNPLTAETLYFGGWGHVPELRAVIVVSVTASRDVEKELRPR